MQYLRLPNSKYDIRISPTGELKSFDDPERKVPKTYVNHKGYKASSYSSTDGKSLSFRIHRMVGLLYIEVPDRLKDIPITELQINHIDGDKLNCNVDNLEWMTNAENMKHARDTGLFSNEKGVLVKCILTEEIKQYRSLSEVCRIYSIHLGDLSIHLNQKTAGSVVYKNHRFKFDNDLPWYPDDIYPTIEQKFSHQYKLIGINQQSKERWIFRSLPEACRLLSLSLIAVRNNKQYHNKFSDPMDSWRFEYISDNKLLDKPIPVLRLDRITGEVITYRSTRICAKNNNIDHMKLFKHLASCFSGMLPWRGYYFKYDNGSEFPNVEYAIPNSNIIGKTIRWLIYNELTNQYYPLASIAEFAEYHQYDPIAIYHHMERVGIEFPFNNFKFIDVSKLPIRELIEILKSN